MDDEDEFSNEIPVHHWTNLDQLGLAGLADPNMATNNAPFTSFSLIPLPPGFVRTHRDATSSSIERRSIPPPGKPKRVLRTVRDLAELMMHERQLNSSETTNSLQDDLATPRSAILFKVTKIEPSESCVTVSYLPLSYAGLPLPAGDWTIDAPVDVTSATKNFIHLARYRRSRTAVASTASNSCNVGASSAGDTAPDVANPPSQCHWPSNVLPVELFEMICQDLSPQDVRSMRLTSREFCAKVSPTLFKEVVVPFTSGLYDMIEDDVSARLGGLSIDQSGKSRGKGKSKAKAGNGSLNQQYLSQNYDGSCYLRSEQDAHKHGLRVFQGFGPHMSKFGLRFDVTEAELALAPTKSICRPVQSYHGVYDWPPSGYPRFGRLAQMERAADETPRMTAAFSCLQSVREIGLSIDSGLGYLSGPDRSHHAMVFNKPSRIFQENEALDDLTPDSESFWLALRESHQSFTGETGFSEERLLSFMLAPHEDGLAPVSISGYEDTSLWPSCKVSGLFGEKIEESAMGIFYTTHEAYNRSEYTQKVAITPGSLTSQQKQWLLETGWAQSAFMDTYILALADNPQVFHRVKKLTISKMSSGVLSKLNHTAFWNALPNTKEVTLLVSPEWRTVEKDEAGDPETLATSPSEAVIVFHAVLRRMSLIENINTLRFGYTDGGEHAQGILGRNAHLMPAPVAALDQLITSTPKMLRFENVENLALVNCWITPNAMMGLATSLTGDTITRKNLSLDSVSLTAHAGVEPSQALQNDPRKGAIPTPFRQGCWPALIDKFKTLLSATQDEEEQGNRPNTYNKSQTIPKPSAERQTITLTSCGYATLPLYGDLDQSSLSAPAPAPQNAVMQAFFNAQHPAANLSWFHRRSDKLQSSMQHSDDKFLGRIASWAWPDPRESTMLAVWGFAVGWGDGARAEAAEFDGKPRGGTGRFSGVVRTPRAEGKNFGGEP